MGSTHIPKPSSGPVGSSAKTVLSGATPKAPQDDIVDRFDQPTVITNRPPSSQSPLPSISSEHSLLTVGDRLHHFEIQEYVGGGGMGFVYKALDTMLNRPVAIKVLSPQHAVDEDTVQRFLNEAKSAALLDHENIARVYFVGQDKGLHYIAFEFVDGINIRQLVEKNGLTPLPEALSYILQVAGALEHASQRGVVHRDIKPSNLLVTGEGAVKLVDMGLARIKNLNHSNDLTASGVTLGTFDYISPEQARDPRNADVRSDVYSLGCTLYFMLAARPPFPEGTVLQKLLQHQGDEPPDPREFNPSVPEEVTRILRKMMAKDPLARYQSPRALMAELLPLAEHYGIRPLRPMPPQPPTPQENFRARLYASLPIAIPVVLLFLIVGIMELAGTSPFGSYDGFAGRPADRGHNGSFEKNAGDNGNKGNNESNAAKRTSPDNDVNTAIPASENEEKPSSEKTSKGSGKNKSEKNNTQTDDLDPAPEADTDASTRAAESKTGSDSDGTSVTSPDGSTTAESNDNAKKTRDENRIAADEVDVSVSSADLKDGPNKGSSGGVNVTGENPPPGKSPAGKGEAGSSSNPDEPSRAATDVPANPLPAMDNVLLVGDVAQLGPHAFATLEAACSKAKHGDVIELRYSGHREERPFSIYNKKLRIRGGSGYLPVIIFSPKADDAKLNPARSMITVSGEQLQMEDVALELRLPRGGPERRSLFALQQAELLRLENCWLTIGNASDRKTAYHPHAAFIEVLPLPGGQSGMADMVGNRMSVAPRVELVDSAARGEASFLRCEEGQSASLFWNNGFLSVTEQLLVVNGGSMAPARGARIDVELHQLTASVKGGMAALQAVEGIDHPPVSIECLNSIIVVENYKTPFISQRGADSVDRFRRLVTWRGDGNWYDNVGTARSYQGAKLGDEPVPRTWDEWLKELGDNERNSHHNELAWRNFPKESRSVHTHAAEDFLLEDPESYGADRAGCDPRRIPNPPLPDDMGRSLNGGTSNGAKILRDLFDQKTPRK